MPENPEETLRSLKSGLRWLVIATVVLFIAGAAVAGYVYLETEATHDEAHITNAALCALRDNLEGQVATSREFLAENPNGIPGISAATLRTSTQNQERAIVALSVLSC